MKKRKYPLGMFVSGVFLNLLKTWYILALAIIVALVRIFLPAIPVAIPLILLSVWLVAAIITQFVYRKTLLNFNNGEADEIVDAMLSGEKDWRANTRAAVYKIIEENRDESDE
ncbi:MAG: hypothetical protein LBS74_06065 [Oscillospiraceae bacterium]|jgi:MFS superfamily sulfate permease-like transporter|nr:hypothetical protein [Oscillospiraceae bacterium]